MSTLISSKNFDLGTGASNVIQLDGSARLPTIDGSQLLNTPVEFGVACGDETTVLASGQAVSFVMPFDMTATGLHSSLVTAPSTTALEIDVEDSGVSILDGPMTIAVSGFTSETGIFVGTGDSYLFSKNATVSIDIDQVDLAAAGLKLIILGQR